jgi:tetratricopeptide (TPR) repeat protein
MSLAERALAAQAAGKLEEAEECYRQLAAENPAHPSAPSVLNNLGLVLVAQRRFGDAVLAFEQSLAARPKHPATLIALANALTLANRPQEAIERCNEALAVEPGNVDARHNKAVALRALNRFRDAMAELEVLLSRDPDDADAEYNLALTELALGDYLHGWPHYEARWRGAKAQPALPLPGIPLWKPGLSLQGQRVLVQAEQGLGDTLMFIRFIPRLVEQCAAVELQVQEPLAAFVQRQWPHLRVGALGDEVQGEEPQLRVPLMSLPLAMQLDHEAKLTQEAAYLQGPASANPHGERRVGFAWRGRPTHQNDHNRSIPVETFKPWLEAQGEAGAKVFSLQKGATEAERAFLAAFPHVQVLDEALRDFDATAVAIAALDEVVCVDTSVAHLAGGMGRPTTVLLPFSPDWRWGLERDSTPLYPTLRLVRQQAIGGWPELIERLSRP